MCVSRLSLLKFSVYIGVTKIFFGNEDKHTQRQSFWVPTQNNKISPQGHINDENKLKILEFAEEVNTKCLFFQKA